MKGYRFYEELENKNRKGEKSQGTVIALCLDECNDPYYNPDYSAMCISGVYYEPNSPVCGSSVGREYLADKCRRISEARAREIHPALFKYLERGEL